MEVNNFINEHLEEKNDKFFYLILSILPIAAGVALILIVVFQFIFMAKTALHFEEKIRRKILTFREANLNYNQIDDQTNNLRNESGFRNLHNSDIASEIFDNFSPSSSI
ncbi:hypothetical protein BpHYR1_043336 [Brachionus plicatilis]|uniref:Uncharacterized protein n=1 Tax=Brachionus plicatilis TaxID=10195 RepID=A0A3M7QIF7_BRAPC|nr:hypothetical protein BpHYR1_043336 [Brachionus plicatilis]